MTDISGIARHPSERTVAALPWRALSRAAAAAVAALMFFLCIVQISRLSAAPAPPAPAPAAPAPGPSTTRIAAAPPLEGMLPALPSPARGTTGTTTLPPLPAFAAPLSTDPRIAAARPFSMAKATPLDRARALECLTTAIYYEAASEPDAGQRAVAQVVLNRARHPAFPASICGVVYQGSERAGCQFSFACDGAMARMPVRVAWARAARNAAAALAGGVFAPVGLATHYHTYAVTPSWNRTLVMTDAVGAHFFHRWKGWWGTAAAFRQAYAGHEPQPGPHAPVIVPPVPAPTPLMAAPVPPPTPLANVQPPYAQSGTLLRPQPLVPEPPTPTGESQILDRWKDSGKPLR